MQHEFTILYERYKDKIFSYLYYLSGDMHMAEELSQDVFLKIYLNISKFRGQSSFKTWAFSIARNTYLSSMAREGRNHVQSIENLDIQGMEGLPEEHVLSLERRDLILGVLNRMPENYKTIIVLRDSEGMKYEEIADIMGISVSSVKITLFRARKRFREIYERAGDE